MAAKKKPAPPPSLPQGPTPFVIGLAYLIRTVTHYWTGRVAEVYPGQPGFLVLTEAAWIADTGRYAQAKTEAALKEIEPREEPAIIGLGAIIDAVEWKDVMPRSQR